MVQLGQLWLLNVHLLDAHLASFQWQQRQRLKKNQFHTWVSENGEKLYPQRAIY
jgi:hypothetical protein